MCKRVLAIALFVIFIVTITGCSSGLLEITGKAVSSSSLSEDTAKGDYITVNGNIPASAKYIGTLDAVTPIKANIKDLAGKIEKKLGRKPRILVSSVHMTNDWNRLVSQSAINAGKEAGAEIIATNAQGNWNKQVDDIERAIASKVDAIVIAGGIAMSLQEVIKKAADAKIPVTTGLFLKGEGKLSQKV